MPQKEAQILPVLFKFSDFGMPLAVVAREVDLVDSTVVMDHG